MEHHRILTVVFILAFARKSAASLMSGPEKAGEALAEQFEQYYERGLESSLFNTLVERLSTQEDVNWLEKAPPIYLCTVCHGVFKVLLKYYYARKTPAEIETVLVTLCTALKLSTPNVCSGLIALNLEPILYILNNTQDLNTARICGIILQSISCSADEPSLEWTVDVDMGPKPQPNESNINYKDASDKIEIIQLTDIHYQDDYVIGGNAACNEPMCCRSSQGNATDESGAAGYWGDYRKCDLPWHTVESILTNIKSRHKDVDYVYMTGDIVDHAVWDTSREKNSAAIVKFLKKLKSEFQDIPVYPILGNHETHPVNVFAPTSITQENISTNWLFELVADLWSAWLPSETRDTILKGGFYTLLLKPGWRIIVLNNNVCYTLNWWLLHDPKDPYGQLKWLAETLIEAEKSGEKVHILGHIPSGDPWCLKTWSREYQKIIDRFEYTVTAQFNGHTHYDEYQLFYSSILNTSSAVAFNGGSVTTYDYLNPNFKVYYVDPELKSVIDYDTWTFNLTEANLDKDASPKWYKLYSCREAYEMRTLSPKHLHDLAYKMAKNETMMMQYHRFYVKDADPMLQRGCDNDCQMQYLCQIVTANTADNTQCAAILKEFERS